MHTLLFLALSPDLIVPEPAVEPDPPEPILSPADALALEVVGACGDPYALEELRFTFIAEKEGEELARRSYVWAPQRQTVEASWEGFELTLSHLSPPAAEGATAEQIEQAHAAFINDSYWLLAPCKVLDPGVQRSLDDQGRLVLSFDGVGLTPGDVYRLSVDPETGLLSRWDFTLQSGREGGFTWQDYTRAGPLTLATRHENDDGTFVVRFEEVSAR